ncbi:MAG: tRNA lysidine(34) synthetase TilS [Paludibacteraceae bacterium]|nr:tRNA lysidine(34) synthetase TilS [Paludibacteraceae bacterium]
MLHRVNTYIRQHGLLHKGQPVLVCVSGGADSIALLDVLHRSGYECVAAHCNFHLRGEESNRDEEFVRQICEQMQVRLHVKEFDTISYAKTKSISIEMAARELRYQWFDEVALCEHCQAIAVAHHMNDQAETIILNLRRGTGLRGLTGMRPVSPNPMAPESIPVIRPFLCTTRDYIEHYLQDKRNITWMNDSTNNDTSIMRNAVREQLCSYTKAEIEHIAQTAEYMQGYLDILNGKDTREAGIAKLYEELRGYGFQEIDKIYAALEKGEGGKTFTSKTHQATIKNRKLCITTV